MGESANGGVTDPPAQGPSRTLRQQARRAVMVSLLPLAALALTATLTLNGAGHGFNAAAHENQTVFIPMLRLDSAMDESPGSELISGLPGSQARYSRELVTVRMYFVHLQRHADAYERPRLAAARAQWDLAGTTLSRWQALPPQAKRQTAPVVARLYTMEVDGARAQLASAIAHAQKIGPADLRHVHTIVRTGLIVIVVALVAGLAAAGMTVSRLAKAVLKPLAEIRRGLEILGGGDLGWRLRPQPTEELDAVCSAVNAMAHKLDRHRVDLVDQAHTDSLTALPNRLALTEGLEAVLQHAHRRPTAVLLLDLDRFKEINDTLGHHYGDKLLCQVGPRIRKALRSGDLIARFGGDEFALVVTAPMSNLVAATEFFRTVAAQLVEALTEPFLLEEMAVAVEASIGVAIHPAHGTTPDALLQRADIAMYAAKNARSGYAIYDPAADLHSPRKLALLGRLRQAIFEGELVVHYQPIVSMDGHCAGVEALVRWQHPDEGLIYPDTFIPLAESNGLIHGLTAHVLRAGLRQAKEWCDSGRPIRVSINVSARCLLDVHFPDTVAAELAKVGLSGDFLKIEITESAIVADPRRAIHVLRRLDRLGVRLAIDDFGTGYTSMAYLRDLPVHDLKIDRSFVAGMLTNDRDGVIVRTSIELANRLGMTSVAEGVETREIHDALVAMGCDQAQGYLYGRPVPPGDLATMIPRWPGDLATFGLAK